MTRTKGLPAAVLIAVVLALTATAPASAGQFTRECGDHLVGGSGWWNLKTIETACRVARRFADSYVFEGVGGKQREWGCREKQVGDEVWRTHCHRDKKGREQRLKFLYGA